MTAISPNLISWTMLLLCCYLRGRIHKDQVLSQQSSNILFSSQTSDVELIVTKTLKQNNNKIKMLLFYIAHNYEWL